MQLTKFRHSCVRIDEGERTLVLDPGVFSDVDAALDGADAVLITHEHPDHIDVERVRAAARADPRLRIWGPAGVAEALGDLGEQVVAVAGGESFKAAGFALQTFGGQHEVLHQAIPVIANVCFLVEDAVYHPGDSFTVPNKPVDTLLLPAMAPWAKVSEILDFAIAVRAPKALPIHDGLVNDIYGGFLKNLFEPVVGPFGVELGGFDETVVV